MSKITYTDKVTGGTFSAADANEIKNSVNTLYDDKVDKVSGKSLLADTEITRLAAATNLVSDSSYVHTDNNYTTTEKNKLSGIEAGAQVNPTISQSTGQSTTVIMSQKATTDAISAGVSITVDQTINQNSTNPVAGGAVYTGLAGKVNTSVGKSLISDTEITRLAAATNLVSDASYVHTDNNFTTVLKDKLTAIGANPTTYEWQYGGGL